MIDEPEKYRGFLTEIGMMRVSSLTDEKRQIRVFLFFFLREGNEE